MSLLARFFRPTQTASTSRLTLVNPIPVRQFSASSVICDKLKSHSGTKKRFFKTGGGLVCPLCIFGMLLMNSINVYVIIIPLKSVRPEEETDEGG
jgi:hypothetical protein